MQTFTKYLNPLYKDIDAVSDFSDVRKDTKLLEEEYPHLEKVSQITKEKLQFLLPKLHNLEQELEDQILIIDAESDLNSQKEAKSVYNKILAEIELTVGRINNELITLDSPYFGKISFLPYDATTGKPIIIYIGKFAMLDKDTHLPLITDWRSPIANVYYQNSGPKENTSYIAPIGERKGDLLQKRQFQISRARIKGIYDAKSGNVAADEFLLVQLHERLGKKLQDIVATIQSQQNEIIREDINTPILMQGVAGSGKTTILLHRLAYILYTYKEQISDKNTLIIAPNQMFIDYVSDVLPNLGVRKIDTLTYLFWGKKILGWDKYYTISNLKEDQTIKEFKGSIKFLEILDKYIEKVEEQILDNMPYSQKELVAKRYYELKNEFENIETPERLELALEYVMGQKQIRDSFSKPWERRGEDLSTIKNEVLRYFKKSYNPHTLYKNLFRSGILPKDINKYTLDGLTANGRIRNYRIEDLAPIVYIYFKIHGVKEDRRDYVMVDEAQDMSFTQLATLAMIAKNANIAVTGDLAQSIIPPFYIKDWSDVITLLKKYCKKDPVYYQLNKCYRTTVEIVEFANRIFEKYFPKTFKLPEAVLRHGEKVEILEYDKEISELEEDQMKSLLSILEDRFEKGAVTCALLCKDKKHANNIYTKIKKYEKLIGREVVSYLENDYQTGLLVLPIESAKGLEFDCTVILDLTEKLYTEKEEDIKLLYVAMTRALHKTYITTTRESQLLNKLLGSMI